MIQISYKNKNKDARSLIYNENNLAEIGYDIQKILDDGAEILAVFRK